MVSKKGKFLYFYHKNQLIIVKQGGRATGFCERCVEDKSALFRLTSRGALFILRRAHLHAVSRRASPARFFATIPQPNVWLNI